MSHELVVAVTGVSGFLGQRLLPLLDASPQVDRVIGLDVRDPSRRARKLDFHRVDVLGSPLAPFLRGADAVVHLAAVVGTVPDEELVRRVNVDGTRRLLDAAGEAGVRKFVRPSSVAVYGAWANNPVPLTEEAPLRPTPGYLPGILDAECERLLAEWANAGSGRIATRLRIAPVLGAGATSLLASIAIGEVLVRVRGAAPPVQVVHVDDAAAALELATAQDLDGVYNVAADGWLTADEARALVPTRRLPGLPAAVAERVLTAMWSTGISDAPPSVLPFLVNPCVVANDRLELSGWKPRHSNDEAILLATASSERSLVPWIVGAGVAGVAAALTTWALSRRVRRRRMR